ncbi:MAG: hypothetical protein R3B48_01270 [Kofleriaceae bacterium]
MIIAGTSRARPPGWAGLALLIALASACGSARPRAALPAPGVSSTGVGECAEPLTDGVIGEAPKLIHADRDLGGDARPEQVVADRNLCDQAGNCHWNVFIAPREREDGCVRYAGTLSATTLEPMPSRGQAGMRDVRGYWTLSSGRILVQEYRFARGGYRVVDTLLCRTAADDRLECAEHESRQ